MECIPDSGCVKMDLEMPIYSECSVGGPYLAYYYKSIV